MRTFVLLITLSLVFCSTLFAQPDTLWTRTFGGGSFDYCYSVRPTNDNGFILSGYTQSFGAGSQDVYIVKTDAAGDTLWTRTYGTEDPDNAWQIRTVESGGFIACGFTHQLGGQGRDIWLLRLSDNGDTLWTKIFTGAEWEDGFSVTPTSDGGFAIAGYTQSHGTVSTDFYLIKTNSSGDSLWSQTYGSPSAQETCIAVAELSDGFVLAGYTSEALQSNFLLIRTDLNGDSLWSSRPQIGECYSMRPTSDGGFILIGQTAGHIEDNDWGLVKLSDSGIVQWSQTYGGEFEDVGSVVEETSDGGYICGGYMTFLQHSTSTDFVLIKTNADGDSLWSTIQGGQSSESCSSIQQLADGSFVAAGGTFSEGAGLYDFYLVRLEAETPPPDTVLIAGPERVDFGTRWLLDDTSVVVSITNVSDEPLLVNSIDTIIDWEIFSTNGGGPHTINPGQSHQFEVNFNPTMVGEFTEDAVEVIFEHETSPLTIPLTGTGAEFDLDLSLTSINFAVTNDDRIESVDLELINYGDSTASVSDFIFADYANLFTVAPTAVSVAPDEVESVTITVDMTGQPVDDIMTELCLQHEQWPDGEACIDIAVSFVFDADDESSLLPARYSLSPAYPNPFNPETTIEFALPRASEIQLTVFDIAGRTVATLANGFRSAGHHDLQFTANDLPSGVYFYRLSTIDFTMTRKMVLMK